MVLYPPEGEDDNMETAKTFMSKGGSPRYDHLVAIERVGRAEDGGYYSMKAIDVSKFVGGVDWLFMAAADIPLVHTTGEHHADFVLTILSDYCHYWVGMVSHTLHQ